jgi:hypothetical protein
MYNVSKLSELIHFDIHCSFIYYMCIPVSAKQLEKAFPNELGGCLKGFLDLNHEQSLADIVFGYLDRELLQSQVMNIFASLKKWILTQICAQALTYTASDSSNRNGSLTVTRVRTANVVAYEAFSTYCEIRRIFTELNGLPTWTTRRAGKLILEELQRKVQPNLFVIIFLIFRNL